MAKNHIETLAKTFSAYCPVDILERDYTFRVKEEDILLISYPKSGNTWMRFLLAHLLTEKKVYFDTINYYVVDIYTKNRRFINAYRKKQSPAIFKSHSAYRPKFANNRIIYIVRDPRDVFLSYYNWYYHKKEQIDKDQFFDSFIRGETTRFGSWEKHVGSWLGAMEQKERFLMVTYEDMICDAHKELERVVDFLNLDFSADEIDRAVRNSSFERLQRKQKEQNRKNENELFFRKGTSGQWKQELPDGYVQRIGAEFSGMMRKLNYD